MHGNGPRPTNVQSAISAPGSPEHILSARAGTFEISGPGARTGFKSSRSHLYCSLLVTGFANGISERVAIQIDREGIVAAFYGTFGVSIIVWAACVVAILLLLCDDPKPIRRIDLAVAAMAAIAFLLPIPSLSWLASALVAAYLTFSPQSSGLMRRAAAVIGAITVPMLWAKVLFAGMSNLILVVDAKLVSWVVGTQSAGNTIPFADGSGILFIEPGCSSLINVSLTYLCGVLFMTIYDRTWSVSIVRVMVIACSATIALNVVRMSTICIFPTYYDLIHGPFGSALAGTLTIALVLAIYIRGIKPDA